MTSHSPNRAVASSAVIGNHASPLAGKPPLKYVSVGKLLLIATANTLSVAAAAASSRTDRLHVVSPNEQPTAATTSANSVTDPHRRHAFLSSYKPFGYQSGVSHNTDNDDAYAGGLSYDPKHHALHITGSTYSMFFDDKNHHELMNPTNHSHHLSSSECFVSVLNLPPLDMDNDKSKMSDSRYLDDRNEPKADLVYTRRFGSSLSSSKSEICSSVFPVHQSDIHSKLYAIGHTEGEEPLTSLRSSSAKSKSSSVDGFIADLDMPRGSWNAKSNIQPAFHQGEFFTESKVQYPVAITARPGGEVFVALMETNDDSRNEAYDEFMRENERKGIIHPDLSAGGGGGVQEWGRNFGIRIQKLRPKSTNEVKAAKVVPGDKTTMHVLWSKLFKTANKESATVSSMLLVPMLKDDGTKDDILLFAGSTRGYGTAFGTDVASTSATGDRRRDLDGFVTKMDPNDGYLDADYENGQETFTQRISSKDNADDVVTGLCMQPGVENVDVFYAVGTTRGKMDPNAKNIDESQQAFITKIELDTMKVVWSKQIGGKKMRRTVPGGTHDVLGLGCAVTPDGFNVFVAGNVKDGSAINGLDYFTKGKDDIFVMELQTRSGTENFLRQMGTSEDDNLALGGGITVDKAGNPIVMGTTRGSFMRWRGPEIKNSTTGGSAAPPADVFVMSLERSTAHHRESVEDVMKGTVSTKHKHKEHISAPKNHTVVTEVKKSIVVFVHHIKHAEEDNPKTTNAAFVMVLTVVPLLLAYTAYKIMKRYNRSGTIDHNYVTTHTEELVFANEDLQGFKDENVDVDVKRSSSRGWHGTFKKKGYKAVPSDDANSTGDNSASSSRPVFVIVEDDDDNTPCKHDEYTKLGSSDDLSSEQEEEGSKSVDLLDMKDDESPPPLSDDDSKKKADLEKRMGGEVV